jgi:predicted DNA-binding transcriptional regulator YafY
MERLVRLAIALQSQGRVGLPGEKLIEIAGFAEGQDATSQLNREFRQMRALGWQIDNIAPQGEHAVYRMTSVDNRLRVRLTPGQQAALQRAALLADRADLVERLGLATTPQAREIAAVIPDSPTDERLASVIHAVRMHCLLRFGYAGSARLVQPDSVRAQNGTWYLRAFEDAAQRMKVFVVSRMSDVAAEPPGTARSFPRERHPGLHPMSGQIDPPVEVTLRAPVEYVPDVERWLGRPVSYRNVDDGVELIYVVTHRSALRARIYQLGTRVQVIGPEAIRKEILTELAEMAGDE